RRIQALGQIEELFADSPGVPPERELDAAHGAEEVRDERKVRTSDPFEKESGPAAPDDALRNLGDLEAGIHFDADPGELAGALEVREEASQIGEITRAGRRSRVHCRVEGIASNAISRIG